MLFRTLSDLEMFTSFCVFRCGGHFAAVALSLQNLLRTRFSWSIEETLLLKWSFAVMQLVFCTLPLRPSPPIVSIERIPQAMNECMKVYLRESKYAAKASGKP
jgi:hypothetical protein